MRRSINYLLILLVLFTLCSCVTTKPDVDYIMGDSVWIKKTTLTKMLDELIWQKQQLMECLEREKK